MSVAPILNPVSYNRFLAGASEGSLFWYGQPSEVRVNSWGGVAEPKYLEILGPNTVDFIDSQGTWDTE